ncbi:MAG: GNAT family N-acetyltransferase [Chromatiales bacterium]|jgi:GNAT superfamily N-acetyltransferase
MQIDKATPADIPQLCDLLEELFSQEAEFTPDREKQSRALAEIIDNAATGVILVARQADRIIAMVNLLYTISTALGGRVALLEDMVVAQAHRGSGYGSALLQHAINVARDNGCLRISLLTDQDNAAARAFYLHHGFQRSSMLLFRQLL